MSSLFSFRQQDPREAATRTACSKLSNNAALVVNELAREPAQGLMHVVTHVQASIPVLLHTHRQLEAASAQLQAVLAELQDAQEGILSVTSPVTQQDLSALAASISSATDTLQQRHDHIQQQQQTPPGSASAAAGGSGAAGGGSSSSSSSSSKLRKLFAAAAAPTSSTGT